jgi:hypothetical protein
MAMASRPSSLRNPTIIILTACSFRSNWRGLSVAWRAVRAGSYRAAFSLVRKWVRGPTWLDVDFGFETEGENGGGGHDCYVLGGLRVRVTTEERRESNKRARRSGHVDQRGAIKRMRRSGYIVWILQHRQRAQELRSRVGAKKPNRQRMERVPFAQSAFQGTCIDASGRNLEE